MFDSTNFISKVRELVSILESEELSDESITNRANEVFFTKFIDWRFKSLFRRKITLPITRFSSIVQGFLLMDDHVRVLDISTQREDTYGLVFSSQNALGTEFSDQSLVLPSSNGTFPINIHPLFLRVSYDGSPVYFDNTSFSFSDGQQNPIIRYDEANSLIRYDNATSGVALRASGFTKSSPKFVIFEGNRFIFFEDMISRYIEPSFEVHGIFQPFLGKTIASFFANPVFFERLYLLTAREILYFYTQIEDPDLFDKIDRQIALNEQQMLAMSRSFLDVEQRNFHNRSINSKFYDVYSRSFYYGGTGQW